MHKSAMALRRLTFIMLCIGMMAGCSGKDVDLGSEPACQPTGKAIDCTVYVQLGSCNEGDTLSGSIVTPRYPMPMIDSTIWGKYTVVISSCPNSLIVLNMTDPEFNLGSRPNTFSVGDGGQPGVNSIPPQLVAVNGQNEFPNNVPNLEYRSTNNAMWMVSDMSFGFSAYLIRYQVVLKSVTETYYYDPTGRMTSSGFNMNFPIYPSSAGEERHFIDVSDSFGPYADLLLTVDVLDISGTNGDFIKIGPDWDLTVDKGAALVSWQLNRGFRFLINGPRAYLSFVVSQRLVNETVRGFAINYQAIDKNLTTPAPTTALPPTEPTPLPIDLDILLTSAVFYTYDLEDKTQTPEWRLAEIFKQYASSSNELSQGEIVPEISEKTVKITYAELCYHGWNVDLSTCAQAHFVVENFLYKSDESPVYAFPRDTVKAAIRQFGMKQASSPVNLQIVLPEDLLDIYWISVGCVVGVACVIFIILLVFWRQRIRQTQRVYHELNANGKLDRLSTSQIGSDAVVRPAAVSGARHFEVGRDNPNFVVDEDDIDYLDSRTVVTYDPDKGGAYSRASYGSYSQAGASSRPNSAFFEDTSSRSSTVMNTAVNNIGFDWHGTSIKDGDHVPMTGIVDENNSSSRVAPKRGILKSTSFKSPFPPSSSIMAAMGEEEDDDIYDVTAVSRKRPPAVGNTFFPSSSETEMSSSPSPSRSSSVNSVDPRVQGVKLYLENYGDQDSIGETNL